MIETRRKGTKKESKNGLKEKTRKIQVEGDKHEGKEENRKVKIVSRRKQGRYKMKGHETRRKEAT